METFHGKAGVFFFLVFFFFFNWLAETEFPNRLAHGREEPAISIRLEEKNYFTLKTMDDLLGFLDPVSSSSSSPSLSLSSSSSSSSSSRAMHHSPAMDSHGRGTKSKD